VRLDRKTVAEREDFVQQLFRKHPELSIRGAQRFILSRYGSEMRPHRVLVLRRQVLAPVPESGIISPDATQR
jgi:hypothetical protein